MKLYDYNTSLDVTYGTRDRDMSWNVDLGVKNQIYNWYGLPVENIIFTEDMINAIDGNSILNRAFYGIKLLTNSKGFFTNAITGFMNIYLKEIETVKPDCVAVAFDLKAPTFRHKAVSTYKANRKGMPPELHQQFPVIKVV